MKFSKINTPPCVVCSSLFAGPAARKPEMDYAGFYIPVTPNTGMSWRYCGFGSRPPRPSECRKTQRVVIFLLVESCLQVVKHAISVKRNRAERIKRRMPALCKALASHAYLTGYRGQLLFHFTEGKREKWRHKGTCPQLQRVVEPLETFGPPDPEYGPSLILNMNDTPKS